MLENTFEKMCFQITFKLSNIGRLLDIFRECILQNRGSNSKYRVTVGLSMYRDSLKIILGTHCESAGPVMERKGGANQTSI